MDLASLSILVLMKIWMKMMIKEWLVFPLLLSVLFFLMVLMSFLSVSTSIVLLFNLTLVAPPLAWLLVVASLV